MLLFLLIGISFGNFTDDSAKIRTAISVIPA